MESSSSDAIDLPSLWNFSIAVYFAVLFVGARSFLDRFVFRLRRSIHVTCLMKLLFIHGFGFAFPRTVSIIASAYLNLLAYPAIIVEFLIVQDGALVTQNIENLATWLLYNEVAPLKINEAMQAKIVKCSESMWKLTYYATAEMYILKFTYQEIWFTDSTEYFRGWPNQELKLPIKLYYMCQCGFYLFSIAALLTWETRRKDFAVMMSHHIITVILISYSYLTRFFRIGSIVLLLHDASDVFMEAAKVFKYSEKELRASVCFGLFAISWLILRLLFFPFCVIKASSYYFQQFLPLHERSICFMYYVFNTMLLTLLVFHIYWWYLICAMIQKQMRNRGQVGEDIRSDSEDDD